MLDALTLDQMRVFVAVAESGSFRAAAGRLSRVQSAVSHAIANLEGQLRIALFDRSRHRPTLTPEGQSLLADVRAILLKAIPCERGRLASAKGSNCASRSLLTHSFRWALPQRHLGIICTMPIRRSACSCGRHRSGRQSSRFAKANAPWQSLRPICRTLASSLRRSRSFRAPRSPPRRTPLLRLQEAGSGLRRPTSRITSRSWCATHLL